MTWNWEQTGWPGFSYRRDELRSLEEEFLKGSGLLLGAFRHLDEDGKALVRIDVLSEEALRTSEIEGEYLNRDSIQSSIRRHFGLQVDNPGVPAAEQGIAQMMVDVYETWAEPLSHEVMWRWQEMLAAGRNDIEDIGRYRRHADPMRVVSGAVHKPKIHYQAPPSESVPDEMESFVDWFNRSAPSQDHCLPALVRAGVAHLYFVSIHPFEDGNGRVARALSEKALGQSLEHPTLIALALAINERRRDYYEALERNNKGLEITDWLTYFAQTVLAAQVRTLQHVEFVISKGRFFARHKDHLNSRQQKVILRMFREGPQGFLGDLSAANYISITGTSPATATRDLQDLVTKGVLARTGQLKHTRYHIPL